MLAVTQFVSFIKNSKTTNNITAKHARMVTTKDKLSQDGLYSFLTKKLAVKLLTKHNAVLRLCSE